MKDDTRDKEREMEREPLERVVFRIVPELWPTEDGAPATYRINGVLLPMEYEIALVPGPDVLQ